MSIPLYSVVTYEPYDDQVMTLFGLKCQPVRQE